MSADVLIVGGGVAGLSCGVALADAGLKVLLLEASHQLGGRAASWTDAFTGDVVDIGPHVIASEYRHFLAWLRRLGTDHQVQWQPQPLITLLDGTRRLRMRSSSWPAPLHGLPNLGEVLRCVSFGDLWSNKRAVWQALRASEADALAHDDMDALQWLRNAGVQARFIDWFWASATMALLNVPLQQCSAAAVMRMFRLLSGRSGYCFGFPQVGLAELYAPGARRVIESKGGEVRLHAKASRLSLSAQGRVEGVVLADGSPVTARATLLALPPAALAELAADVRAHWPAPAEWAQRFQPSPYVSTYLWFDRRLGAERFWARVWSPQDLNLDFYDLSNIRPCRPDAPSLIAANSIHALQAASLDDEEIVRRTVAEIADFAPEAAQAHVRHAAVHRIPMAIACPHPGTERLRPPVHTPLPGLWMAGDWLGTGLPSSMESAARAGAMAAEAIGGAMGRTLGCVQPVPPPQGLVRLLSRQAG